MSLTHRILVRCTPFTSLRCLVFMLLFSVQLCVFVVAVVILVFYEQILVVLVFIDRCCRRTSVLSASSPCFFISVLSTGSGLWLLLLFAAQSDLKQKWSIGNPEDFALLLIHDGLNLSANVGQTPCLDHPWDKQTKKQTNTQTKQKDKDELNCISF